MLPSDLQVCLEHLSVDTNSFLGAWLLRSQTSTGINQLFEAMSAPSDS